MTSFDLFSSLLHGFSVAGTWSNLLYCLTGAAVGTLVGVLPGLGPVPTMALLLPLTFGMDPTGAIVMLGGIYYGAQYGGSITAILANVPGETSSTVTTLDGYAMAQQGRAGPALTVAALGSFFAGCMSTFVIAGFSPVLAQFAVHFGPEDYFSLMVLGLVAAVILARGSVLKAIAMLSLGVFLGLVGTDINSGQERFTFGIADLSKGLDFVTVAMGMFGIAEILMNLSKRDAAVTGRSVGKLMLGRDDIRRSAWPIFRGSLIGSVLGVLPGGGAVLGSFTAYTVEKKLSSTPERFGHGAIEGVAAPESANNAGAQTSFIPLLTLGIPGNGVTAMLLGALMIHGVAPGPNLMREHPDLFWGVIASMLIGNLMLVILNLPLIGLWVRLLRIPYRLLYIGILLICCVGVYSLESSPLDVALTAMFGLVAFILRRLDFDVTPVLLGFVLGPLMEDNLRRSLLYSRGDLLFFLDRPVSCALLVMTALLLITMLLPSLQRRRNAVFEEKDEPKG
jgi:putative tricarboxylic transport membrane protein